MDYSSTFGNFGALSAGMDSTGTTLGLLCHTIQHYLLNLSPERRTLFAAVLIDVLNEGTKPPPTLSPASFMAMPQSFPREDIYDFLSERQRQSNTPNFYDPIPSPFEQYASAEPAESPTENIAFRTIPCRNWIRFKGNCRLGDKCKFIHDPAFISHDPSEEEFPASPTPHCWSYIQGTCVKEKDCKYYHPPQAHLSIYQRYTPCREWDSCTRPFCGFRHAPISPTSSKNSSPTSLGGFEDDPSFGYRSEFPRSNTERPGSTSRATNGVGHINFQNSFNPHLSLDPIEEEYGLVNSSTLGSVQPVRRNSMVPTRPGTLAGAQPDYGGFGNFDQVLPDAAASRPRGKSFDVSFMLSAKRNNLPRDLI